MSRSWADIALFAANLDRLMTAYGVSNATLARATDVKRQAVFQWRTGRCLPMSGLAPIISQTLHCTVADLTLPLYASNLRRYMRLYDFDAEALRRAVRVDRKTIADWLTGVQAPSLAEAMSVCAYMRKHGADYDVNDLFGFPDILPLRRWAIREKIPLRRASDLFGMQLLSGAVDSPFGLLVPAEISVPENSKHLVIVTKLQRAKVETNGT